MRKARVGGRAEARRLLVVCCAFLALGCVDVGRDSGATPEEALAIESYATQAQSLEPARRHLLAAWAKLAEAPTYEGFNSALRVRVLPAVEAYLTALEGCTVKHADVNAVHRTLVESYGRFLRELRALSSKAASSTPSEVEEGLRKLLVVARQAQAVYQQDISTLYARSGYKLVVEEAKSAAPSPQQN